MAGGRFVPEEATCLSGIRDSTSLCGVDPLDSSLLRDRNSLETETREAVRRSLRIQTGVSTTLHASPRCLHPHSSTLYFSPSLQTKKIQNKINTDSDSPHV